MHEEKNEPDDFKMVVDENPIPKTTAGIKLKLDDDILTPNPQTYSSIDEIKLPPGTIIGAVVRGNDVMIANDNLRIEQGDHVIMFLTDKKFITDVERLFQPSPFFL